MRSIATLLMYNGPLVRFLFDRRTDLETRGRVSMSQICRRLFRSRRTYRYHCDIIYYVRYLG